ncbi:MAG: hypothetical protein K6T83_00540 [Alicyclobacillus sp.]|nr:hypothetical protein [Alicyclobacillus sp.]
MSSWWMMLSKDLRMLRTRWLVSSGILAAVAGTVGVTSTTNHIDPGLAMTIGVFLVISNVFVLPANVFRSLSNELRWCPSLWLQTPKSGWSMLASKLLSTLIWALLFLVATSIFASWIIHVNIVRLSMTPSVNWSGDDVSILTSQTPRLVFYAAAGLLLFGLYFALWVSTIFMSVRAVKNRLRKFSALVGVIIVLVATWGLSAFQNTRVYDWLFDWGRVSPLILFPANSRAIVPPESVPTVPVGIFVFYFIVSVILFYIAGRLIDRHVEV